MTEETNNRLSRRKALARIGGVAVAAYTIPAFTMLSAAHAGSSASPASDASEPSEASGASGTSSPSEASGPSGSSGSSEASAPSASSGPSGPQIMTGEECEAAGGEVVTNETDGTLRCVGLS